MWIVQTLQTGGEEVCSTGESVTPVSGTLVSNVTLRLLEPACSIPAQWLEEPLPAQASRTLHQLLECVNADPNHPELFPASAVGFFYYLLASVLKDGGKVGRGFSPFVVALLSMFVPAGSPSRGGDVVVYVFDINQPSLPTPFCSVLVSISVFMALSTVFHSINSLDNSPLSHSVLPVLFLPYWFFQLYISLGKSPLSLT